MEDDHNSDFWNIDEDNDLDNITLSHLFGVTLGFKAKPNAQSMYIHESSFHTYHIKNGCRITNVIIYNIYYTNNVFNKRLSRTLLKHCSRKTP
jgi:hypothetical protein